MSGLLHDADTRRWHPGDGQDPTGGHAAATPRPPGFDQPEETDPASRSLSEALLVSFRILKIVMLVLVVAYLASGVFTVQPGEEAIVLRFGKVAGPPRTPGLRFSLPYPIDEKIIVPVKEKKTLELDSFWFQMRAKDLGKELDLISPMSDGLNPVNDGALITGDKNLVHLTFLITYRIADPQAYVLNVIDEEETYLLDIRHYSLSRQMKSIRPIGTP